MLRKQTVIILYTTDSALLVYGRDGLLKEIPYKEDVFRDKKVQDKNAFINYLSEGVQPLLRDQSRIIVVLGRGVLFQEGVQNNDKEKDKKIDEFYKSLPFSESERIVKQIETENKIYVLVSNRELLESILEASQTKGVFSAIIPISLFTDEPPEILSPELLSSILDEKDVYTLGNFLESMTLSQDSSQQSKQVQEESKSVGSEKPFIRISSVNSKAIFLYSFIIAFLLLLLGSGYLLYQNQQKQEQNIAQSISPSPSPTITPTPQLIAKEELRIEVLNGTGTPGQAGKVKTALEDEGFENIETGNADERDQEETTVVFASSVSDAVQKEIVDILESLFTVVIKERGNNGEFAVRITTGSEK